MNTANMKLSEEAKKDQFLLRAKNENKLLLRSLPNVIGLDIGFRVGFAILYRTQS